MTDANDNLVLRVLQEMRAEAQEFRAEVAARDEKVQAQIGVMAQEINGMKAEMIRMRQDIRAITLAVDQSHRAA